MIDFGPLWDFREPAASEQRLREATDGAEPRDVLVLHTQVARALGLQERFAEAHALLDAVPVDDPEVAVRVSLERGRLLRSAGEVTTSRPFFDDAAARAEAAGLDNLHVDALHMVALVVPVEEQLALHEHALAVARASSDQAARDWEPTLLNNLGMTHADALEWPLALAAFEAALAGREARDDVASTRVAKWMVAWALRHLDRSEEALAMQRALKAELVAAGEADPYVEEELELLTRS